jgi:hypothetical protein
VFLVVATIIPEKGLEKTSDIPLQQIPGATPQGANRRQRILPARSSRIVNHQNPMATPR